MDEKECLGQKIRALRKSKKITQEKLSELVNVCPRHMVKIEMGQVYPSYTTLKKIADTLEVPIHALFENDYYDSCENLKQKLHEKIDILDDKNTRFLYIIASHLD